MDDELSVLRATDLYEPRGLATDERDRLYVIDKSGFVLCLDLQGQIVHRWELPDHEAGTPTGLTVDDEGRVFIADAHYSRVLVFDTEGHELARFGEKGTGPGQFLFTNDVEVDCEGYVYVSEYGGNDRVSRFAPDFTYLSSFGGPDDLQGSLAAPSGLAFDNEGTLWVVDTGNHRLCRYTREGKLLGTVGGLGRGSGEFRYPRDIACLPSGRLLVCDRENQRIQLIDATGDLTRVWTHSSEASAAAMALKQPTGLTVTWDGTTLLVADSGNQRVLKAHLPLEDAAAELP